MGLEQRTCELTSSVVPRGTSFHRLVELEFPSIGFDPEEFHAAKSFHLQTSWVWRRRAPAAESSFPSSFDSNRMQAFAARAPLIALPEVTCSLSTLDFSVVIF